jgi:hypothetical protein
MRGTRYAGFTLIELARVHLAQQRPAAGAETAEHALGDLRRREDARGIAGALTCLGRARGALGGRERARAHLDEAVEIAERWGFENWAHEARQALSAEVDVLGQEPAL